MREGGHLVRTPTTKATHQPVDRCFKSANACACAFACEGECAKQNQREGWGRRGLGQTKTCKNKHTTSIKGWMQQRTKSETGGWTSAGVFDSNSGQSKTASLSASSSSVHSTFDGSTSYLAIIVSRYLRFVKGWCDSNRAVASRDSPHLSITGPPGCSNPVRSYLLHMSDWRVSE
jgi:hypothetical protein